MGRTWQLKYDSDSLEQMAWDNLLIKGWFKDTPTHVLMGIYGGAHKGVDFSRLRRMPQGKWQMSACRRFVAAYLPTLSNALWDGLTQQDALFKLMSSNLDNLSQPSDKHKAEQESRERKRSKGELTSETLTSSALRGKESRYTKSGQWGVCK